MSWRTRKDGRHYQTRPRKGNGFVRMSQRGSSFQGMRVPKDSRSISEKESKHTMSARYDKSGREIIGFYTEEHTIQTPEGPKLVDVVHPITLPRQTEGTQPPPPIQPAPGVKPATKEELEEHPIVLRGDPMVVEKYQPIVDSKFEDLSEHPVSERAVKIEEEHTESGVGGFYRIKFIDAKTGETHKGPLTLADFQRGDVVARPDKIVIDPDKYTTSADRNQAFIHEVSHMRRNIQEDAKLSKLLGDTDTEEKENVLETYARLGVAQTSNAKDANYYGYYLRKHPNEKSPQVQLDDQETIGTYSPGGISETAKIEDAIIKNKGKTKLNTVRVAKSPYSLQGIRYKPGGGVIGPRIDTSVLTTDGYYYHFYSPQGNITRAAEARTIIRDRPRATVKAWELKSGNKKEMIT